MRSPKLPQVIPARSVADRAGVVGDDGHEVHAQVALGHPGGVRRRRVGDLLRRVVAGDGRVKTATPLPHTVVQVDAERGVFFSPQAEVGSGHDPDLSACDRGHLVVPMEDVDVLPVEIAIGALELAMDGAVAFAEAFIALLPGTTVVVRVAGALFEWRHALIVVTDLAVVAADVRVALEALVANFVVDPSAERLSRRTTMIEPFARVGLGVALVARVLAGDHVVQAEIAQTGHRAVHIGRAGRRDDLVRACVIHAPEPDRTKLH